MAITYAFLTGNPRKILEYRAQLAKYARNVTILPCSDVEAERLAAIRTYLNGAAEIDRFVLRETSDLFVADDLDRGVETISGKQAQGERVYHVSKLTVYTLGKGGALQEKQYRAQVEGVVDLTLREASEDDGKNSWWDDIFVTARTECSYDKEQMLWEKASARQQAIGAFILDNLMFKRLRDHKFNPHKPKQAVDFSPELSVRSIINGNVFVQMAKLDESPWGLGNLVQNLINAGAYYRSADSRRSGNYHCPPISGIMRHPKDDYFWQTTFNIHDVMHQAFPDYLPGFARRQRSRWMVSKKAFLSPVHRRVYVASRLMSEGVTIVLADMLFVEAVRQSGFEYDFTARKINELFRAIALPGGTAKEQLKALLKANIAFTNLGDTSLYEKLLKPGDAAQTALQEYVARYNNFFIPDLLWSAENYDDMAKRADEFLAWNDLVGDKLYADAKLFLLDDLVDELERRGCDLSSYESCVWPVFEHLFEETFAPQLTNVTPVSDEEAISNGFRRYMIGQTFLYGKYRHVRGMKFRGARLVAALKEKTVFGQSDIERIRSMYNSDIDHLAALGVLTEEVPLYKQICPIFSPSFLDYDFDNTPHPSIPAAIRAAFPDETHEEKGGR